MSWRDDAVISPYGRGNCPICGREFSLRKTGRLRSHSIMRVAGVDQTCEGSGQEPKGGADV